MDNVDLNLLVSLDALLAHSSVTEAAGRLGLSPSTMSRTLARLRVVTGDPLLVRAGRSLVLTPFAERLRDRVHTVADEARSVLRPADGTLDPASMETTFTVGGTEALLELICAPLLAAVREAAPHVRLRFVVKPDENSQSLRDGILDLEIGLIGQAPPEIRTQLLFRDRLIGVARTGHPLLAGGDVTADRYAACAHVVASPYGEFTEAIDQELARLNLQRKVVAVVPGFPEATRVVQVSDLISLVPRSCFERRITSDRAAERGLQSFELAMTMPELTVSAMWHPRVHAEPSHRWLRETLMTVCRKHQDAGD